jgi:hypothetical protein
VATLAFTAQEGMLVVDSAGEEIGRVNHLYRAVPNSGIEDEVAESVGVGEAPGLSASGFSPPMSTATWTGSETGFVVVSHGGVMGIGAHHIYVPFSEVHSVHAGERLVLHCTREVCLQQYAQKPAGL